MKKMKLLFVLFSLLIMSVFLTQCKNSTENDNNNNDNYQKPLNPTTPKAQKAWTLLFYNDADFTPGYDPTADFAQEMYGHENLNVLMLRDVHSSNAVDHSVLLRRSPADSTAAIFQVENKHIDLLKELGEVNMGVASTLADFIRYGKTYFPAQRYILSVYDHGGGFSGSCRDDTDFDWLTMLEMKEALRTAEGVDVVMFTAPCLMGSLEAMYEINDYTKIFIGSENLSGFCDWYHYALTDIRTLLSTNPAIATVDFSSEVIQYLGRYRCAELNGQESITMSAVRSDKVAAVVAKFSQISEYYFTHEAPLMLFLKEHYADIQTYDKYNMDLDSLADQLIRIENDAVVLTELNNLKELIAQAVVAEIHGSENPNSRGMAIYCPFKDSELYLMDAYAPTRFALETKWDELLTAYFAGGQLSHNLYPLIFVGRDGCCPPRK
jgi:hypothetical protein